MKRLLQNFKQIKSTAVGLILFMFGLYLILMNGYELYNLGVASFAICFGLLFIFSPDAAIDKVKHIITSAIDFIFDVEKEDKKDG